MRARVIAVVLGAVGLVAWPRAQTLPQSPQTFRSGTDVVMVDVSVRRGNTPVTGLTAADFELRDNGVRQQVETVEAKAVPIDLSIVVDVTGNPRRPWAEPRSGAKVASEIDEDVRKLTRLLREGDRVRLFAIDTYVQQIWPLQPAALAPPVRNLTFDGQSSLYDTLATVLMQPVEPTRRHVIVASTKGLDTISSITAAGLRALAERSDAQMHLVMQETAADVEQEQTGFQCGGGGRRGTDGKPISQGTGMGLCQPTHRFWVPARRRLFATCGLAPGCLHRLLPDGLEIKAGAESTGGGLYQGEAFTEPTLFGTFAAAFENFRQSYVLRYTARGVSRVGWHQITVTVPRDPSLRITARTGYAVDAPAPSSPPATPAPAAARGELRALSDFTAAYGRGDYDSVGLALRRQTDPMRLMEDFDRGGNPWPATPRREAALALELAEAGIHSPRQSAREQAVKLLEHFAVLVRDPIEPDTFERAWLLAELTMLQGTIRPKTTMAFVDAAIARFPAEPRFHLARAIVTDQLWLLAGNAGAQPTKPSTTAQHAPAIVAQYETAATFPEVRAEASIRLGWFLHRTGRSAEAISRLNTAADIDRADPHLGYLRELLSGQALTALGRGDEALAAFRRAMALMPGAQSARVALMNGLLLRGDRAEAESVAEALQAGPATVIDPWWLYWQGDYRRYPQALRGMREMIR